MIAHTRHTKGLAALAAFSLLAATAPLEAGIRSWAASGTGVWNAANWGNVAPTFSDTAVISNSGTATILTGITGTYGQLEVRQGAFELSGGLLTGSNAYLGSGTSLNVGTAVVNSGTWLNSGNLEVGSATKNSSLGIRGGLVNVGGFVKIGPNFNLGTITISGSSGNRGILSANQVLVDSGTLQFNGGILQAKRDEANFIPDSTSGSIDVLAGGAIFDTNGYNVNIGLGIFGAGPVTKLGAGNLTISNRTLYYGSTIVKSGTLTLSGTVASTFPLVVGETSGDNATFVLDGGYLSGNPGQVGNALGTVGAAIVNSGSWNTNSDTLIGGAGTGSLTVKGGFLDFNATAIGNEATGAGSATVTSGTWKNNSLAIARSGTGSLAVNGGRVAVVQDYTRLATNNSSFATLSLSGSNANRGTLATWGLIKGQGTGSLTFNGGALQALRSESNFISGFAPGEITIGNNGAFIDSNGYDIGINQIFSGNGRLTKQGAGLLTLSGSQAYTGGTTVSSGTLALATGSSLNHSGQYVIVGDFGGSNATLLINGSTVTSGTGTVGAFSQGSVAVNSGTWQNSTLTYIGLSSTGNLLLNGGLVTSSTMTLGGLNSASGKAVIQSGTMAIANNLIIGENGQGALEIYGGKVSVQQTVFTGSGAGNGTILLAGGEGNRGTLSTSYLVKWSSNSSITFDGGILQALNNGDFMAFYSNGDVSIASGGAFIDSNGKNIGITVGITGNGALNKIGAGTLTLSGSSTYAAGTTVKSGTLAVSAGGSLNHRAGTVLVGETNGDNGSLLLNGGYVSSASGTLGVAANTRGSVTVSSGTWANTANLVIGASGTGTLNVSGGLVTASGTISTGSAASGLGTINLNSGTFTVGRIVKGAGSGTMTFNGGVLKAAGNQANFLSGFAAGNLNIASGGALIDSGSYSVGISSPLSGSGVLTKLGAGKLTLSGSSSYAGGTTVKSGTLELNNGSIGHSAAQTIVGDASGDSAFLSVFAGSLSNSSAVIGNQTGSRGTATFFSGTWTNSSSLTIGNSGTGTLTTGSGLLNVSGTTFVAANTGAAGTVTLGWVGGVSGVLQTSRIAEGNGNGAIIFNGGILRATGNQSDFISGFENGDVTLSYNGAFIDSNGFAIGVSTSLSGMGQLTKQGAGTLTLSGSNSYAGATTVEGGALLITGDSSDVGAFSVADGATLGGNGRTSDVTIQNGGTLAPGTSPGLLTIEGDLTMEAGSFIVLEFTGTGAGAFDQIAIENTFTAAGTLILNVNYTAAYGDTFTIFTDGLTNRGWDSGNLAISTNLGNGLTWDTSELGASGIITVVPEPSAGVLVALGSGAMLWLRRRKL